MTSGLAQDITTDTGGDGAPVDNAARVQVSADEVQELVISLRRNPGAAVPFTAEYEGTGVYATLSATQARTVTRGAHEFVVLTCHLIDIVTASPFSAGFALFESCDVLVPAPLHDSDGVAYLMPGRH